MIRLELRVGWTGEDRLEVTEGNTEPYGPLPSELTQWQPKTHHVVALDDRRLIGHAGLLRAHVRVKMVQRRRRRTRERSCRPIASS